MAVCNGSWVVALGGSNGDSRSPKNKLRGLYLWYVTRTIHDSEVSQNRSAKSKPVSRDAGRG